MSYQAVNYKGVYPGVGTGTNYPGDAMYMCYGQGNYTCGMIYIPPYATILNVYGKTQFTMTGDGGANVGLYTQFCIGGSQGTPNSAILNSSLSYLYSIAANTFWITFRVNCASIPAGPYTWSIGSRGWGPSEWIGSFYPMIMWWATT